MWSELWFECRYILFVVGDVWFVLLGVTRGEGASRDFGHEGEPFLCVCVGGHMAIVCA